jgi:pimeloyl-ACP methyl ester carboxylesterase
MTLEKTLKHGSIQVTRAAQGRAPGDGVELAFGYWPGRGAAVVGLHGLTASHVSFVGIAERLQGRCALFGLDLRGRGDSDKPDAPYGLAQHGRDVAAAMRAMGLGPSIIVGHSMGAFVATALAAQEPGLVSGLVLIDGGYVPNAPIADSSAQDFNAALALRISQLRQSYPSRQAYREFWRTQPHFPPDEWNRWVEVFLDYEVGGESPVRPKASEAGVLADLQEAFQRDSIVARLKSIRVPTLLLRAESGFIAGEPPLFPDTFVTDFRTYLPHLEDHKFAGTTHYTITFGEHAAGKVADLIAELASRLSSSVET